jgi:6-phosphogluconate dehydrogenase
MQLGMIGRGRTGASIVRRLLNGGHQCVVFDRSPLAVKELVQRKTTGAQSLSEFVDELAKPRAIWLMIPAAGVDKRSPISYRISNRGIFSLMVAIPITSTIFGARRNSYQSVFTMWTLVRVGSVWGLQRGCCMMMGGEKAIVDHLDPIFSTLAPGSGEIPRTQGRENLGGTSEQGYLH